jgi:hypothetical protein
MSFVDVFQNRKINALEVKKKNRIYFYKNKVLFKLYEKFFEDPFLQATGEYYREEGNRWSSKLDCIQYMKKVMRIK